MSKKRKLRDCRKEKQLDRYFDRHPACEEIRNGKGSHKVATGPTGKVIYYANGNEDYPRGTLSKIWRMAKLAGLGIVLVGCYGLFELA